MCNPSISVIVPVFNSREYLKECLDSIIEQSFRKFQIILVDDGSTDGSEDICDEYANKDSRIKVIHQRNSGSIKARKSGLKEADGEFIYYVDSDDWIDQRLIENFMDILSQNDVDMIGIGCKREYINGKTLPVSVQFEDGFYDKKEIRNKIIPRLVITDDFFGRGLELTYWTYLIKKELLRKNLNNLDERIRIGEDVACIYPLWLDVESVYIKTNIYYHHRQRNGSMRSIESPEEYKNLQLLYRVLVNRFKDENEKEILLKGAKYLIWFCILFSGLEKLDENDGIFPYKSFPKGSKVIVYGAGIFGDKVIKSLVQSKYADITAWVDENYLAYKNKKKTVESPKKICDLEYDYIIIGVIRADIRKNIRVVLEEKYHIPSEKIIDVDIDKLNSNALPDEFEKIVNSIN